MVSFQETATALHGAFRLARFDAGGMAVFETSPQAFWRSFWAAVLVAPFSGLLLTLNYMVSDLAATPVRYALLEAIAYVIGWTLFPLAIATLAPWIKRRDRWVGYVIAYNWSQVLLSLMWVPLAVAILSGSLPGDAGEFLFNAMMLVVIVYTAFIARTALAIAWLPALGVVILDFSLNVFLEQLVQSLL